MTHSKESLLARRTRDLSKETNTAPDGRAAERQRKRGRLSLQFAVGDFSRWSTTNSSTGVNRILVMKDENNGGMLMQIVSKCSEYAPPSRMTVQLTTTEGMFDGEQAYQLVDLGNGRTRMEIHSHFHFSQWFASLMEPLITPAAKKKMVGDVARLKSLVESKAALR